MRRFSMLCLCLGLLWGSPVLAQMTDTPAEPLTSTATETVAPLDAVEPVTPPTNADYRARWAQDAVRVLEENGIQLPSGIDYNALISKNDFIRVLSRVSEVPVTTLQRSLWNAETQNKELTRGESIFLLVQAYGMNDSLTGFATQSTHFTDLESTHPAYAAIVLAERVNLINGYPDKTIRPDELLSWGEALILIETMSSWRQALPTTAPEWVRQFERKQNLWYQFIDGFRLFLTLVYLGFSVFFIGRTWYKARRMAPSPYRRFSVALALITGFLGLLWVSELLFNYALIAREVYAALAMLSIFVGLFLLKAGVDMDKDISKPKPQSVIDKGYVVSINHERGEIFIKDKVSESHSLGLVTADSKIYRKTGKNSESAFLSEIQVGDVVSLRASQLTHDALLQVDRLTLVETHQAHVAKNQNSVQEYIHETQAETQQQFNRVSRSHRRGRGAKS